MSRTKEAMIEAGHYEIEDDGFYTVEFPKEPTCVKCLDTGYRRDWRGTRVQCDDCWNDNGPEF